MIHPDAISELERIAELFTEQDLQMMISHGGAKSVQQYIQLSIEMRVKYLKNQQEAAA